MLLIRSSIIAGMLRIMDCGWFDWRCTYFVTHSALQNGRKESSDRNVTSRKSTDVDGGDTVIFKPSLRNAANKSLRIPSILGPGCLSTSRIRRPYKGGGIAVGGYSRYTPTSMHTSAHIYLYIYIYISNQCIIKYAYKIVPKSSTWISFPKSTWRLEYRS